MNWRNMLSVSAKIVFGVAFIGTTVGVAASAAEIRLLCAVALHPAIDDWSRILKDPRDTK
jgi:molybdate transport system substrate-binding protein